MSRTKATKAMVVDERREIELGQAGEAKGDDTLPLLGVKEAKPVVGLVVSGVGVVLIVLAFSVPS